MIIPSSRVVCIRTLPWRDNLGNIVDGPNPNTIYCVDGVFARMDGLSLVGFPDAWWDANEFREVIPESERQTQQMEDKI